MLIRLEDNDTKLQIDPRVSSPLDLAETYDVPRTERAKAQHRGMKSGSREFEQGKIYIERRRRFVQLGKKENGELSYLLSKNIDMLNSAHDGALTGMLRKRGTREAEHKVAEAYTRSHSLKNHSPLAPSLRKSVLSVRQRKSVAFSSSSRLRLFEDSKAGGLPEQKTAPEGEDFHPDSSHAEATSPPGHQGHFGFEAILEEDEELKPKVASVESSRVRAAASSLLGPELVRSKNFEKFARRIYLNQHTNHARKLLPSVPFIQYVLESREGQEQSLQQEARGILGQIKELFAKKAAEPPVAPLRTQRPTLKSLKASATGLHSEYSSRANSLPRTSTLKDCSKSQRGEESARFEVLQAASPSNPFTPMNYLDIKKKNIPQYLIKKVRLEQGNQADLKKYGEFINDMAQLEREVHASSKEIVSRVNSAHRKCNSLDRKLEYKDIFLQDSQLTQPEPEHIMRYASRLYQSSSIEFKKRMLLMNVGVRSKAKGQIVSKNSSFAYIN